MKAWKCRINFKLCCLAFAFLCNEAFIYCEEIFYFYDFKLRSFLKSFELQDGGLSTLLLSVLYIACLPLSLNSGADPGGRGHHLRWLCYSQPAHPPAWHLRGRLGLGEEASVFFRTAFYLENFSFQRDFKLTSS